MKRSTERTLLLAILLSSLIPVLALGVLTGAAVYRMGQQVTDLTVQARRTELTKNLQLHSLEKAEGLAAFLRAREDDLRALSLLPPTGENYLAFYWSTLGSLTIQVGTNGQTERIWIPLYREIAFLDESGAEVLAIRDGEQVPAAALRSHPELVFDGQPSNAVDPATLTHISLHPDATESGSEVAGFDGSLPIRLPVPGSSVHAPGLLLATVDARQMGALLKARTLDGDSDSAHHPESRHLVFFDPRGKAFLYPAPDADGDRAHQVLLRREMSDVIAAVRNRKTGLIASTAQDALLTYTPALQDAGPYREPVSIGGVLISTDISYPPGFGTTSSLMASLTHETELQIGVLTLISIFGVSLAALLVAQRMARPWTRLQEKARAVADPGETGDEVTEISRSFDSLASQVAASTGRLRASEKRLRDFIEMNPDGIAVTDVSGRILHSNRALCQMFRRTPAELATLNVRDLWVRPEDWDQMLDRLRAAGRLKNYEVALCRSDGREFPALLTLRLHGQGSEESVDVITRDISDLKEIQHRDRTKTETLFHVYGELSKAHQELRKAYDEVEEQVHEKTAELRGAYEALQVSDRVKTEFLMKMSHELRTPLNCIIGYSEAMIEGVDGPLSEEQAGSLERIAQSGRRLLRLIENLLDVARIETGKMTIACVETSVAAAVEDVLHQVRSLVGERPIRLEVDLESSLPTAWADPDRLRQVLFNLVGNALKFTQRGMVAIEARKLASGGIEVRVRDTGPGIPAEHLPDVFEKFVQLPGADRSGAGLGLAICRELVESMGGRIQADSEPGVGSTFIFTLATTTRTGQLALPFSPEQRDRF